MKSAVQCLIILEKAIAKHNGAIRDVLEDLIPALGLGDLRSKGQKYAADLVPGEYFMCDPKTDKRVWVMMDPDEVGILRYASNADVRPGDAIRDYVPVVPITEEEAMFVRRIMK